MSDGGHVTSGKAHMLVNGVFSMLDGARTQNDGGRILHSR